MFAGWDSADGMGDEAENRGVIAAKTRRTQLLIIGLHPDKVYPAILARREALLGNDLAGQLASGEGAARGLADSVNNSSAERTALAPKKPPQSIPRKRKEKTA